IGGTNMIHIGLFIISLFLSSALHAAIVFDNFGPGDSYDVTSNPFGLAAGAHGPVYLADGFTPTASFTLDSLQLAIAWFGGPNSVDVSFMDSSANGNPGARIESFHLKNILPDERPPHQIISAGLLVTVHSTLHPLLLPGKRYWVMTTAGDPATEGGWHRNSV